MLLILNDWLLSNPQDGVHVVELPDRSSTRLNMTCPFQPSIRILLGFSAALLPQDGMAAYRWFIVDDRGIRALAAVYRASPVFISTTLIIEGSINGLATWEAITPAGSVRHEPLAQRMQLPCVSPGVDHVQGAVVEF